MMEQLTPVRSLFEDSKSYDGKTVRVGGWVRNLRASKNFGFINERTEKRNAEPLERTCGFL